MEKLIKFLESEIYCKENIECDGCPANIDGCYQNEFLDNATVLNLKELIAQLKSLEAD